MYLTNILLVSVGTALCAAAELRDPGALYCGVSLTNQYPGLVEWYPSRDKIPGGEQDPRWKTDWVLLRRVEPTASPVKLGDIGQPASEHEVTLSRPYYIGVFEITQRQYYDVVGKWPSKFSNPKWRDTRPVSNVSYVDLRGKPQDGYEFPKDGDRVDGDRFLGMLREAAGGRLAFDLPTEAQWEYAGRAGTTNFWNDGTGRDRYRVDGDKRERDRNLDRLGRYCANGGDVPNGNLGSEAPADCSPEQGTAIVGSYQPNAWGLYDFHGNVMEYCRGWFDPVFTNAWNCGKDPVGPAHAIKGSENRHPIRGGCFWNYLYGGTDAARAANRSYSGYPDQGTALACEGFRVFAPAEFSNKPLAMPGRMELPAEHIAARAELLRGVNVVDVDAMPCPVLCTTREAFPVIAARNLDGTCNAVCAAAFHGKGRIVYFGHPAFLDFLRGQENLSAAARAGNAVFHANAIRWLAQSREPRIAVWGAPSLKKAFGSLGYAADSIDGPAGLKGHNILICLPAVLQKADWNAVRDFIREGGGLYGASIAWNYDAEEALPPSTSTAGSSDNSLRLPQANDDSCASLSFPNGLLSPLGIAVGAFCTGRTAVDGFSANRLFAAGTSVPDALAFALSGKIENDAARKQIVATLALARNAVTPETADAAKGFAALASHPDAAAWLPKEPPMKTPPVSEPVLGPAVPAQGILVKSGDTIAFLGDSITRLGAQELGYINLVIKGLEVAGVPNVGKVPAGWDGQNSGDMLGRVDKLLAQPGVTVLTVSCGVNDVWGYDWGRGVRLRDYRANVRGILDKAASSNVLAVVMSPTLIQENPLSEKNRILDPYVDFIRAEARLRKLPLADCNAAERKALEAFPTGDLQRHFTYDGVHPVWEGNKLIARTLLGAFGVPDAKFPEIEKTWEQMREAAEKRQHAKN